MRLAHGSTNLLTVLAFALTLGACGARLVGDPDGGGDAGAVVTDAGLDLGPAPDGGPPPTDCPAGCLVGGTCFPDGVLNPTNLCQICAPALSATAFSPNDGARCDDGMFCTNGDVCADGACGGSPQVCDDGIACNGVATCDEAASACRVGTSTCTGGQFCDALSGTCVLECAGCLVGGTCYGDGQVNALNRCEVCAVATSRTAWSANDGATCDDGLFCTVGDVCADGTCGGGSARGCDDGVACDGVESCDEAASACASGPTTCSPDQLCDIATDSCIATCTGCVIGGTCFGAGQRNPMNQCEVCATASSRSAWSTNDGATCDDGAFCTDGDLCTGTTCGGTARSCGDGIACNGAETCNEATNACAAGTTTCSGGALCDPTTDTCVATCSGCVIGGSCFGAGQVNPTNACQVCTVASSRTSWSDNAGARCDDGAFCTDGDTCRAGACSGTARICSDGVACNGTETCDETADSCAAGTSTCAATEVCNTNFDTCVAACAGCVIGGVCYANATRNPANPCEVCDTARSRAAFSANDGASCDDGLFCTTADSCSGGLCAGSSATNFCADAVTCNGTETCNEATDSCSPGTTTCGAGEVCNPSSNACVTACSGCVIGGTCYAASTRNPANQCQICAPATSTTGWSANTGASCDDGLFCTAIDACSASAVCVGTTRVCADAVTCNGTETCNEAADRCDAGSSTCLAGEVCDTATNACTITCSGCTIGGVCQAAGAVNPANQCQSCQTATSSSGWSPRTGATCDDGAYCTTGETCSAAAVCGAGSARGCADAVSCNGTETCNEATDRCDAGTTTCTGGQVCNVATNSCVLTCVGGTTNCGGTCTNLSFDPANCSACGVVCPAVAHASPACTSGSCGFACNAGFRDCTIAAGCETDVLSSATNCGACGNICTGGTTCSAGACIASRVLVYYDSFSTPVEPAGAAATALGRTVSAHTSGATFATAYDAGGWGVVVIDVPGSALPAEVRARVLARIASGLPLIFSWWQLSSDPALAAALQVTTSDFSTPRPVYPRTGASVNFFTSSQVFPAPLTSTDDAGINGQLLTSTAGGEVLCTFDSASGAAAIVTANAHKTLVLGFLPWDFQRTNNDGDATLDTVELFQNLLQYSF